MKLTLLDILQKYVVLKRYDNFRVTSYTDPADNAVILEWDNDEEQATFDLDTPVEVFGDVFTVTDREGDDFEFMAYEVVNLAGERDRLVDDIRMAHRDFQQAEDREDERDAQRDLDAAWEALRNFDAKGIL